MGGGPTFRSGPSFARVRFILRTRTTVALGWVLACRLTVESKTHSRRLTCSCTHMHASRSNTFEIKKALHISTYTLEQKGCGNV